MAVYASPRATVSDENLLKYIKSTLESQKLCLDEHSVFRPLMIGKGIEPPQVSGLGLRDIHHDGRYIMKISNFKLWKELAKSGEYPSITSGVFRTSQYAYRMKAEIFLNGCGEGEGTHLGVFVILLPGEYDDLLQWPFKQTITFKLRDQMNQGIERKDFVRQLRPEKNPDAFQRPQTEVSIGFTRFLKLDRAEAYVKDDTMFLELEIDTTNLSEP